VLEGDLAVKGAPVGPQAGGGVDAVVGRVGDGASPPARRALCSASPAPATTPRPARARAGGKGWAYSLWKKTSLERHEVGSAVEGGRRPPAGRVRRP